jgi:hypothetical protein
MDQAQRRRLEELVKARPEMLTYAAVQKRKQARELADAYNTGSVTFAKQNQMLVDRGRYEAMEKVISWAMAICNMSDPNLGFTHDYIVRLRGAIRDLLMFDGDRETVIASLLKIAEELSNEDAPAEHAL